MKKTSSLLYLAFSFCGSISFAQQALTPEVLQTLKESYSHDDAHKAIRNAVNANSIKKLTANSEQAATPDTWFSHKVKSSGISDQKSSGRCWLFTGTNVIRAQVMARTGMKNFFFSQAYNFFYDQLEKSNLFLQGIIDTRKKPIDDKMVEWLFRNPRDRMQMTVFPEGDQGKTAVTHYSVLERLGYVTLVKCRLETGRTHQIRVHMKYIGHTLFNDERYGGNEILKGTTSSKYKQFVDNCFAICPRQALHAKTLGFVHPTTGEEMFFDSEIPADMTALIDKWRVYANTKEL